MPLEQRRGDDRRVFENQDSEFGVTAANLEDESMVDDRGDLGHDGI